MRRIRFAVLVLMVSVVGLPAQAFHDPGYPVLASEDLGSGDWVRYDLLATRGAELDIELRMGASGATVAVALTWARFPNGGSYGGMSRIWGDRGATVVTEPTGVLVAEESHGFEGGWSKATTFFDLPGGPITVIIGGAADRALFEMDVILSGTDLTLTGRTSGTGTFVYDEDDFAPRTHVRAPSGLVDIGANGHVEITTTAPLYAWFMTRLRISSTRYEGPAREEVAPPGSLGWIILDGEPAGKHGFFVDVAAGEFSSGWTLAGIAVPD